MILESALQLGNIDYYRVSSTEELYKLRQNRSIPIFKPHGSIDFDLPKNFYMPDEYRWTAIINDNQGIAGGIGTINIVSKERYLIPHVQQDIILPT